MLKRIVCAALIVLFFVMVGCGDEVHKYSALQIQITEPQYTQSTVWLNEEQISYLLSVWNNGEWEQDITKTGYDYELEFDGTLIRYTAQSGLFNDKTNQRHLFVSEEQRAYINAFISEIYDGSN